MIQIKGETEVSRAAGGTPLSFSALPSALLAAVGRGVGVPRAGVFVGVGEVFAVGVTVGVVFTVGVTVGVVWVGAGVTVTGGRLTGVPCGPAGTGVPECVPPGVTTGTGDELAIILLSLALEAT